MRDVVARTADGKLFHAHGAATENARSPKVDRQTGGTASVVVAMNVDGDGRWIDGQRKLHYVSR